MGAKVDVVIPHRIQDGYGLSLHLLQQAKEDGYILAVVNPSTKQVLLINTPRDYYVDTAASAGAKDKLTHCERSVYLFLLLLM